MKKLSILIIMMALFVCAGMVVLTEQVSAATVDGADQAAEPYDADPDVILDGSDPARLGPGPVVYDLNQEPQFAGRTREEVIERYTSALYAGETYDPEKPSTYYTVQPSLKSPYAGGQLSEDTLLTVEEVINFLRWLVGDEPMVYHLEHHDILQAGALVRHFDANHVVSNSHKPDDMDDELWKLGASCPNNALAYSGAPHEAPIMWINEGYNLVQGKFTTFGHRNVVLNRDISILYFGYCDQISIGKASIYSYYKKDVFTAFPPPGIVPNDLVYPSCAGWQLDLDPTRVSLPENESDITVTITNTKTGQSFVRTKADNTLQCDSYYHRIYFAPPTDPTDHDFVDTYQVTVEGLTDIASDGEAMVEYTVEFTDPTNDLRSYVTSVAPVIGIVNISKELNTVAAKKKIAAILPKDVRITTSTGAKIDAQVSGEWTYNVKAKRFVNHVDESVLPENVFDKNNRLKSIKIAYSVDSLAWDTLDILDIEDIEKYENGEQTHDDVLEGSDAKVIVYRMNSNKEISQVFRVNDNGDGTCSAEKRFDSADYPDFARNGRYDIFTIKNVTQADAGEYISMYFDSGWNQTGYLSKTITPLKVVKERPVEPAPVVDPEPADEPIDITAKNLLEVDDVETREYNGKARTQYPDIYLDDDWLMEGVDYELTYENNVNVGKATMIITGINGYKGTVRKTFRIIPKRTAITKLRSGKKSMTVKWRKQPAQTTGYEIQYSLKKNFKSAKTVRVTNSKTTSKTIKKLKGKKQYYVRVRTYKTVDGTDYFSWWSTKQKVKTK